MMGRLILLAQAEIQLPDLGESAPWWGAAAVALIWLIVSALKRRSDNHADERLARYKAEIEDRQRDSTRQDSLLALVSELIIKLNESNASMMKERDALLSVVTTNSAATHSAARQVEDNTRTLLSVTEIIQALRSQMERQNDSAMTAEMTRVYLVKAIEALLRDRLVEQGATPGYNAAIDHLGKALIVLKRADLTQLDASEDVEL